MTANRVTVEDKRNNVTVSQSGIKVVTVGTQGPPGSQQIGGKNVETNPTLNGGEFLIYDATDDRFEFVTALDGGVI